MEYNENIKRYRKEKNLTQEELADKLKVSRRSIVRWENGWNVPSYFYAQKMAELFEITIEELMQGELKTPTAFPEPHKKHDLLSSLVWFCALCCLPLFVNLCVYTYINANFDIKWVEGSWYIYGGRVSGAVGFEFLEWARPFFEVVCLLALVYLTVWWTVKFISIFQHSKDKFKRSILYRQWRFGIFFLSANLAYFLFDTQPLWIENSHISPPSPIFIIIGCLFTGLFFFVLCDVFFKRIMRKKMIVEQNDVLDGVNLLFLIVGFIVFILFCIVVSVAVYVSMRAYLNCVLVGLIVAGFLATEYLSAIAIIKYVNSRRNKEQ